MQSIFKRYEKKYLVTRAQAAGFQAVLARRMEPDRFGEYLVQNLYYDTANWDVIRASIEKPLYKKNAPAVLWPCNVREQALSGAQEKIQGHRLQAPYFISGVASSALQRGFCQP